MESRLLLGRVLLRKTTKLRWVTWTWFMPGEHTFWLLVTTLRLQAQVRVWRCDTLQTLYILGNGLMEKSVIAISFSKAQVSDSFLKIDVSTWLLLYRYFDLNLCLNYLSYGYSQLSIIQKSPSHRKNLDYRIIRIAEFCHHRPSAYTL